MDMTPVERLEKAGLCKSSNLTESEKSRINMMTDEEVDTLVRLREKLGDTEEGREGARPNFPL